MSRPTLRAILQGFTFKQRFLLILNAVLVAACAASALGLHIVGTTPETATAARRFRGESETRFAQIACFLPVGQGKTEEDIWSFRQNLESKFVEQSLEAPENGSLYVDAYSAGARVSVSTDHGSAEISALGVGGDFFYFHPLRLLSGAYISQRDLMDDLVVLDETLAWRLFGGTELAGMTLYINGKPFVVSGVVALEDDFASARAMTQEGGIFLSYSALSRLEEELAIDCYEVVLPDPISGYAYGVVEELLQAGDGEVVENSGRYSPKRLMDVIESFGERSMRKNAVVYPYWENAMRLTEDYAALLFALTLLFALCPLLSAVTLTVWGIVRGWRYVRRAVPERIGAQIERRREKRLEKAAGKKTEGE